MKTPFLQKFLRAISRITTSRPHGIFSLHGTASSKDVRLRLRQLTGPNGRNILPALVAFVTVAAIAILARAGSPSQASFSTACAPVGASRAGNPLLECYQITNTPTATLVPPTPTPAALTAFVVWHAPGLHLDPITHLAYPVHEHGDQPPPSWPWASYPTCVPFSQHREGHVFYKGMFATDKAGKGVESYIVVHVASTVIATSHGDHDVFGAFKTPGTNVISCFYGIADFGTPPPLITATVDPGIRPIILSKNDGYGAWPDCETWYNRPGQFVFDLGWTICNRWNRLDGTVVGGNGAHRGADWHVYVDRFQEWPGMDPNLAKYAVDDGFGHLRLDFVRNDVQFPDEGVTGPN